MVFKISLCRMPLKRRIGAEIQKKSLVSEFLCEKFQTNKLIKEKEAS